MVGTIATHTHTHTFVVTKKKQVVYKLICTFHFREGNDGQPITARALHNFTAERNSELSFSAGDELVWESSILQALSLYIHAYSE